MDVDTAEPLRSCVIVTSREWYLELAQRMASKTGIEFHIINNKEDLTYECLKRLGPRYVFFPHWSNIIPAEVYENFECVIFHMTDLPFGRGGSPLQNLIIRKFKETKISAFRCVKGLDAGPIYLKRALSLSGSASEIFQRCKDIILDMMAEIVAKRPDPKPQEGEPVFFKRRKPEESKMESIGSLEDAYDFIRMLDAPGYPHAYIETGGVRIEFTQAKLHGGEIFAEARLTVRDLL